WGTATGYSGAQSRHRSPEISCRYAKAVKGHRTPEFQPTTFSSTSTFFDSHWLKQPFIEKSVL
ncbi:MAG TPA: hypothetical protein PKE58_09090, partial [Acidobacteriota bacterium]|nr:hypothetical protein [Acidobacteriota bacterium]